MRRAHTIRTAISLVALLAWTVAGLPAQTSSTQAKQQTPSKSAAAKPAPAKAAPSQGQPPAAKQPSKAAPSKGPAQTAKQPSKAAPPASKPASQAAGQAKQPSKAAKTKAPAKAKAAQPAAEQRAARRDPFEALVNKNRGSGIPENLPPGKAGLMVSTLRLDGLVRGPNGMIAVVSNPQQRTYFLREGDKLYDGRVERITLEAATFHETGKDAFGKPVERQVVKRLYSSPGESR